MNFCFTSMNAIMYFETLPFTMWGSFHESAMLALLVAWPSRFCGGPGTSACKIYNWNLIERFFIFREVKFVDYAPRREFQREVLHWNYQHRVYCGRPREIDKSHLAKDPGPLPPVAYAEYSLLVLCNYVEIISIIAVVRAHKKRWKFLTLSATFRID